MFDYSLNSQFRLTEPQNEVVSKYGLHYELVFSRIPQLKSSSIKLLQDLNNLTHSRVIKYDYHNRIVTLECNIHGIIYENRPERILSYSRCPLCKSINISSSTKIAMQRPDVKLKVTRENQSMQHKERFKKNMHKGVTLVPTSTEQEVMQFMTSHGFIWNYQTNCPSGYYKSDFVNLEHKLIVELDGSYHTTDKQKRLDTIKDKFFEDRGFKTYRFTNKYVRTHRMYFEKIINSYLEGGDDLYDRLYIK